MRAAPTAPPPVRGALAGVLALTACLAPPAARAREAVPPEEHVIDVRLPAPGGRATVSHAWTTAWRRRISLHPPRGLTLVRATCAAGDGEATVLDLEEPSLARVPRGCRGRAGSTRILLELVAPEPVAEATAGHGLAFVVALPDGERDARLTVRAELPDGWSACAVDGARVVGPREGGLELAAGSGDVAVAIGPLIAVDQAGRPAVRLVLPASAIDLAPLLLRRADAAGRALARRLGPPGGGTVSAAFSPTGPAVAARAGPGLLGWDAPASGGLEAAVAAAWTGPGAPGLRLYLGRHVLAEERGEASALRRELCRLGSLDAGSDDALVRQVARVARDALRVHVLRRALGEDSFWSTLGDLDREARGWPSSAEELARRLGRATGAQLEQTLARWSGDRLPDLAIEVADGSPRSVSVRAGTALQGADVVLRVTDRVGETADHRLRLDGATPSTVLADTAARVELDPGWEWPRFVAPTARPRGPGELRREGELLVIHPRAKYLPTPRDVERAERYGAAAARISAVLGAPRMASKDVAEAEHDGASLWLLGRPEDNRFVRRLAEAIDAAGMDVVTPGRFLAGDRRWTDPSDALLLGLPHPVRPGGTVVVLAPNSLAGLEPALPAALSHPWGSWLALRAGWAIATGSTWPQWGTTAVELAPVEPAEPAARLLRDVRLLELAEHDGREPGTPGSRRAAALVGRALRRAGWSPVGAVSMEHSVVLPLFDLPRQPLLRVVRPGGGVSVPVTPAWTWLPGAASELQSGSGLVLASGVARTPVVSPLPRGLVLAGTSSRFDLDGLDVEGAGVVVTEDRPGTPELGRLPDLDRLSAAGARGGAAHVLVVLPTDPVPPFRSLATYPSLNGDATEEIAEARAAGDAAEVARRTAAILAPGRRLHAGGAPLSFAGPQLLAALDREGARARGDRAFDGERADIRFICSSRHLVDRNVLGRLGDGPPGVLLAAAHDGRGAAPDGALRPAAAEAAGVAVLLEVARQLAADPPASAVHAASLAGRRWGEAGAWALTTSWRGATPPRVVVEVGGVGRGGPLVVLGNGRAAEALLAHLLGAGLSAQGAPLPDRSPWSSAPGTDAAIVRDAAAGDSAPVAALDAASLAALAGAVEEVVRSLAP